MKVFEGPKTLGGLYLLPFMNTSFCLPSSRLFGSIVQGYDKIRGFSFFNKGYMEYVDNGLLMPKQKMVIEA